MKSSESLILRGLQFDPNSGELIDSDGNIVPLRRQSADVLSHLVAHSGVTVSKDELLENVWPGGVVTDDSVVQCVADIRRVLGRDAVKTYPKKGYRLVVTPQPIEPTRRDHKITSTSWPYLALLVALFAVTALGIYLYRSYTDALKPPENAKSNSVALLPFVNLGQDKSLQFFSDGLGEDLTTDLSKVNGLTVISYSSSLIYQNAESGFGQIASELGVRYLVRGTVRPDDDQIRINVSLIDPINGENLWAERYDRFKANPFEVQEEVTRQIVNALSLTLVPDGRETMRIEPDAYYMLWKGLEPLRKNTLAGNSEARDYFNRALLLSPDYARAHSNVAVTYARDLKFQRGGLKSDGIEKGLAAAVRAIQLDPSIPHAYYAVGLLNLALKEYDLSLAGARHAIKLNENYADGYALLAESALYGGDLDEAMSAIERAKLLHPNHTADYQWLEGHILFQLDRFKEAALILDRAAIENPEYIPGKIIQLVNYVQLGQTEKAAQILTSLRKNELSLNLTTLVDQMSYRSTKRTDRLLEGLHKVQSFLDD